MTQEQALKILEEYQAWRRYDGPIQDSPTMQEPKLIGEAIDVAIDKLKCKCTV